MRAVPASKVYRLLYPAVPAVVAAYHRGRVAAMPAASVVSLSNEPPIVGFSSSPSHATRDAAVGAGCFSLSWLDASHAAAVDALGRTSGAGVSDKLRAAGLHHAPAARAPVVPVIREASAYLACTLSDLVRFGDHELLVGAVLEARAIGDFREYWTFERYRPILYSGTGRPAYGGRNVRRP
ncbi:MAG: flavin reductase family protein [Nitrososphaerales archaeon]|jgi:flavin reductase (DIM6/NTAB) family NADH-FMN oxidoreductase RutF